jgi:hypothetical protein
MTSFGIPVLPIGAGFTEDTVARSAPPFFGPISCGEGTPEAGRDLCGFDWGSDPLRIFPFPLAKKGDA